MKIRSSLDCRFLPMSESPADSTLTISFNFIRKAGFGQGGAAGLSTAGRQNPQLRRDFDLPADTGHNAVSVMREANPLGSMLQT
jgi:hypothetical protein